MVRGLMELKKRLTTEKPDVPVHGVADFKQDETIKWVEERLKPPSPS
jgi:hypothetical protein